MTGPTLHIRGELYLTLEAVAECYAVEVTWVRQVYELDLLGPGEAVGDTVAIAACMLDVVADVRRTHLQTGLDLDGIAWLFRSTPRGPGTTHG